MAQSSSLHLVAPKPQQPLAKPNRLDTVISRASDLILSQQHAVDGYWWYTLEANESINAEYILLTRYLQIDDRQTQLRIAKRIEKSQREDGSWPLFYEGPGDLSVTLECYFALKLMGWQTQSPALSKARHFILSKGGASQCRIFTRIHLALFGVIPWDACPTMPVSMIHLPQWAPFSIYGFSSWARACIVPLLVLMDQKKSRILPNHFLSELFVERSLEKCNWSYRTDKSFLSWERALIESDKILKLTEHFSFNPLHQSALKKCEQWIRSHIERTEDIYPALAYGAMALYSLGYSLGDPTIQKCLRALKSFQIPATRTVPEMPSKPTDKNSALYQQCCISPVWDTPWAAVSLVESGLPPDHPSLVKSGRWLLSKQILGVYGDWSKKNKKALPGGWSFEFQNDFYPDVDDTIQVLLFLKSIKLPEAETTKAFGRALQWFLSMQSKNGGWAAFDVNNDSEWVNRIPFSDHGACIDPPTPDITGRALELLALLGYKPSSSVVRRALHFIEKTQLPSGAWQGRWGVNTIYGTWCVLQGLKAINYPKRTSRVQQAVAWLKSIQRHDGGFGESCESYAKNKFVPVSRSVPSQTAWGLMALMSAEEAQSVSAQSAAAFLMKSQNHSGGWNEEHFTGTGFPGHFYIRYHGYRYYFPLMALAKYRKATKNSLL